MSSAVEVLPELHGPVTRRWSLARLGAVFVGVAMAQTLATQTKAFAAPPRCCYGYDSCQNYGCTCPIPATGGCCWYCSTSSPCYTWQCCDLLCNSNNCICAYGVGPFC